MSEPIQTSQRFRAMVEAARQATGDGLDGTALASAYREIERQLDGPPARPARQLWAWGALAAAAGAAALVVILVRPHLDTPAASARLLMVSGSVAVGQTDVVLAPGKGLRLAPGTAAHLAMGADAKVALVGPAEMTLSSRAELMLHGGIASFAVRRHQQGSRFVVRAGDAEVIVHGTEFVLSVEQGRLRAARVEEGVVEIRTALAGAEALLLRAGESWGASAISLPEEGFAEPWWQSPVQPAAPAWLHLAARPEPAQAFVDGHRLGETPARVQLAPGEHRVRFERPGFAPREEKLTFEPGAARHLEIELTPLAAAPEPARPPPAATRPAARRRPSEAVAIFRRAEKALSQKRCAQLAKEIQALERIAQDADDQAEAHMLGAECYLRTGERRRALAGYLDIARRFPEAPSAEVAEFEAAKLHAALGMRALALEAFADYVQRHPAGRFVAEAAFRRCELFIDLGELGPARGCLDAFRGAHPGAPQADDALLLLAALARIEKRFAEAAQLYRDYLARPSGARRAEEALFQLVICLDQGALPGRDEAILRYLERFPEGERAERVRGLK